MAALEHAAFVESEREAWSAGRGDPAGRCLGCIVDRPLLAFALGVFLVGGSGIGGMVAGGFSLDADNGGFRTRDTLISDRQAQLDALERSFRPAPYCLAGYGNGSAPSNASDEVWGCKTADGTTTKEEDEIELNGCGQWKAGWLDLVVKADSVFELGTLQEVCALQARVQGDPSHASWCQRSVADCDAGCNLPPVSLVETLRGFQPWLPSGAGCGDVVTRHSVAELAEWAQDCIARYRDRGFSGLANRTDPSNVATFTSEDGAHAHVVRAACAYFSPSHVSIDFQPGGKSGLTRILFPSGLTPLSSGETFSELSKRIGAEYWKMHERWLFDRSIDDKEEVQVGYDNRFVRFSSRYALNQTLKVDMIKAAGAAALILASLLAYSRSVMLSLGGLLHILLSVPLSYCTYVFIAGIDFFPFLNFMGVFVIIGVGADDIFVFLEAFRGSRLILGPEASTEDVLRRTLVHAGMSMAITSLSTAGAFFTSLTSKVAPLRTFGLFLGLLVIWDYILVMTLFPCLVVAHAKHGDVFFNFASALVSVCAHGGSSSGGKIEGDEGQDCAAHETNGLKAATAGAAASGPTPQPGGVTHPQNSTAHETADPWDVNVALESFLTGPFFGALDWGPMPYVIVLAGLALGAYGSWKSLTQFEPPATSAVPIWPGNYPFAKYQTWSNEFLSMEAIEVSVTAVFGLVPEDNGNLNEPEDLSTLVRDAAFDFEAPASQEWFLSFCERWGDVGTQRFRPAVSHSFCFMTHFDAWLAAGAIMPASRGPSRCPPGARVPLSNKEDLYACLADYFLGPYLAMKRDMAAQMDAGFAKLIDGSTVYMHPETGKVIAVTAIAYTKRLYWFQPYDVIKAAWEGWERWMDETGMEGVPRGMDSGFHSSGTWRWMDLQGNLVSNVFFSMLISLALGLGILLATSLNVITSALSLLAILLILALVSWTLLDIGWSLGFLESICFGILVGLAMDFVVHFSHRYSESGRSTRRGKTLQTVGEMGIPILAGGITTVFSGLILLWCTITFFSKFGIVLLLTMGYALAVAFLFFTSLLLIAGPEGRWGDLGYLPELLCQKKGGEKGQHAHQGTPP